MRYLHYSAAALATLVLWGCGDEFSAQQPGVGGASVGGTGGTAAGGTNSAGGGGNAAGSGGTAGSGGDAVVCGPGTADCNDNPADGCETNITTDPSHCGQCEHSCLGGECEESACQPVTLADGISPASSGGNIAHDTAFLYVTQGTANEPSGIRRIAKQGGDVGWAIASAGVPRGIAVDSDFVFWIDPHKGTVQKANKSLGTNHTPLVPASGATLSNPIGLSQSHVIFHSQTAGEVLRVAISGGAGASVDSAPHASSLLAGDGDVIYWSTSSNIIKYAQGTALSISHGHVQPRSLCMDETHVYWTDYLWGGALAEQHVWRIPKEGNTAEKIGPQLRAYAIALDVSHVYAADAEHHIIWRMPKAGGAQEILHSATKSHPIDLVVDDVAIYWINEVGGAVMKLAK